MSSCWCMLGFYWECTIHTEAEPYKPLTPVAETVTRALKDSELVTDPKSTGRKRAVNIKPINDGDICEWAGLLHAGGGVFPIVGCLNNPATHIHHGPDKNTLNNDEGNLHKICATCHVRWHTRNDPTYEADNPGQTWVPASEWKLHDPNTKASPDDQVRAEVWWATKPTARKVMD